MPKRSKKNLTIPGAGFIMYPSIDTDRPSFRMDGGSRVDAEPVANGEADTDKPLTSPEGSLVKFPEALHFNLGDHTAEFGGPQQGNSLCCLVTEGVRASPDLQKALGHHKINGKAICFTSAGLTITVGRERARYMISDPNVLFDIVRFDDGMVVIDARHKRKAVAWRRAVETIEPNTQERKDQINSARRTLAKARKEGTATAARKRDRMAVVRRELLKRGFDVPTKTA